MIYVKVILNYLKKYSFYEKQIWKLKNGVGEDYTYPKSFDNEETDCDEEILLFSKSEFRIIVRNIYFSFIEEYRNQTINKAKELFYNEIKNHPEKDYDIIIEQTIGKIKKYSLDGCKLLSDIITDKVENNTTRPINIFKYSTLKE